jgi:hypothetical protein
MNVEPDSIIVLNLIYAIRTCVSLLSNWDNSAKYKIPLKWKEIVYQKKNCCFFYFNDSGLSCQEGQKEGCLYQI